MPDITDPMDGFVSLREGLRQGGIQMEVCEVHPDLGVLLDQPGGELRVTYAIRGQKGELSAMVNLLREQPIDDIPCFGVAYAVAEELRGQGLAQEVLTKALDEFRNGMFKNGVRPFYVEAIVATTNGPSNTVARKLISGTPEEGVDQYSGVPIFQYLKLFE